VENEYLAINMVSVNPASLSPTGSSKKMLEQLAANTVIEVGQDK